jgi:phosphohistidine phosphatase
VNPLRLIVFRHAKSSWSSSAVSDHQRPLNERGRQDAPLMGAKLAELGWVPDLVWSSDSVRTRMTWDLLSPAFPGGVPSQFSKSLYQTAVNDVRELVAGTSDSVHTLLLLGHNPTWEELVEVLTGTSIELKTASCALLSCQAEDWADAIHRDRTWVLEQHLRPHPRSDG